MAQLTPLPFVSNTVGEIKARTFVSVDLATGLCVQATNLATTKGLTVGTTSVEQGEVISVASVKDTTQSYLVEAGGTIAKGARVCANASGLAVTDAAGPMQALEAGVAGQIINVLSFGAF